MGPLVEVSKIMDADPFKTPMMPGDWFVFGRLPSSAILDSAILDGSVWDVDCDLCADDVLECLVYAGDL